MRLSLHQRKDFSANFIFLDQKSLSRYLWLDCYFSQLSPHSLAGQLPACEGGNTACKHRIWRVLLCRVPHFLRFGAPLVLVSFRVFCWGFIQYLYYETPFSQLWPNCLPIHLTFVNRYHCRRRKRFYLHGNCTKSQPSHEHKLVGDRIGCCGLDPFLCRCTSDSGNFNLWSMELWIRWLYHSRIFHVLSNPGLPPYYGVHGRQQVLQSG